ncbi:hypothetical protein RchiOBHm_Chr6g0273171 [Rosa chinensis]|uniref:Uncharacterized protein n=1 Tax=Rosa chinensis TaxID=74649 RepID=A0A2P6PRE1_ROSCH|nr:hypothetical protein RchiOBHm_Chr6g0273171 [Rosa chinensis]
MSLLDLLSVMVSMYVFGVAHIFASFNGTFICLDGWYISICSFLLVGKRRQ